eukprot:CAMPEP_0113846130 /NCGR_PEP_ID=MMETSP0372-20130328/1137_1 /TAXON_ID=340204 /ORGANISM="Lankesteria abbotti" /LENGTH=428 /DNA_ID=CAMNT_0000815241 /DNA_START=718 /DNA_END=2005 /DNA_ORIENTATION=+ /assembly_acc=CAM_ASM_000359
MGTDNNRGMTRCGIKFLNLADAGGRPSLGKRYSDIVGVGGGRRPSSAGVCCHCYCSQKQLDTRHEESSVAHSNGWMNKDDVKNDRKCKNGVACSKTSDDIPLLGKLICEIFGGTNFNTTPQGSPEACEVPPHLLDSGFTDVQIFLDYRYLREKRMAASSYMHKQQQQPSQPSQQSQQQQQQKQSSKPSQQQPSSQPSQQQPSQQSQQPSQQSQQQHHSGRRFSEAGCCPDLDGQSTAQRERRPSDFWLFPPPVHSSARLCRSLTEDNDLLIDRLVTLSSTDAYLNSRQQRRVSKESVVIPSLDALPPAAELTTTPYTASPRRARHARYRQSDPAAHRYAMASSSWNNLSLAMKIEICSILRECASPDPTQRPTAHQVLLVLKRFFVAVRSFFQEFVVEPSTNGITGPPDIADLSTLTIVQALFDDAHV